MPESLALVSRDPIRKRHSGEGRPAAFETPFYCLTVRSLMQILRQGFKWGVYLGGGDLRERQ